MFDIGEKPFTTDNSAAVGGTPTTWGDVAAATWDSMLEVDNSNARLVTLERAYDDRIDTIERAGILDHGLVNPMRVRAPLPSFDQPDPMAAFDRRLHELADKHPEQREVFRLDRSVGEDALERMRAAEERARNAALRYGGHLPTWTATLSGGIVGSVYDPANIASLAAGPWGRVGRGATAVLWQAVKAGAVNAGTEAAIAPVVQYWRREAGLDYGLSPAAFNVMAAFGLGFGLESIIRGGFRLAAPRAGFVPRLDDRGLIEGWNRARPEAWEDARGRTFEPVLDNKGNVAAYRFKPPTAPKAPPTGEAGAPPAPGPAGRPVEARTGARLPEGGEAVSVREGGPAAGGTPRARLPAGEAEGGEARPAPAPAAPGAVVDVPPPLGAEATERPPREHPLTHDEAERELEITARRLPADHPVRRAREGDLDALDQIAREAGIADRPDIRGARQTAELQGRLDAEGDSPFLADADRAEALAQAVRNGLDPDNEPPVGAVAPTMPTRAGHAGLGDVPSSRVDYVVDGKPVRARLLKATDIGFDNQAFPPNESRTDILAGAGAWDPFAADHGLYVFERADGALVVAEGHNRIRLAHRLQRQGYPVEIDVWAEVFREADGWTVSDVRARAAKKNVQEGRLNDPIELATILRERPDILDASIPRSAHRIRQAAALSRLSDAAWARVLAGDVEANHAAIVGRLVEDRTQHGALVNVLAKVNPTNEQQVRGIINDLVHGPRHEMQEVMLGGDPGRGLLAERAQVLDRAIALLKADASIFAMLVKESRRIESLGNALRLDPNADRVLQSETVRAVIEMLAARPGPVRDWLSEAAARVAAAGTGRAARRAAADAAAEAFAQRIRTALQTEGLAALRPHAPEPLAGGRGLDEPGGAQARQQVASLEADLQTALAREMHRVAERWLDRFEAERAASGGRMDPIPPDVRQEAIRLIAGGEDASTAVATARRNLAARTRASEPAKTDERAPTTPAAPDQYSQLITGAGAGLTPEELARFRALGGQFGGGEVAARPLPTPGQLLPVEARDIPNLIETWRELQQLRALPEEQRAERRFRILQLQDDLAAVGVPRSAATEDAVREALQARVEGRVPEDRAALLGSPDQHPEAVAKREFVARIQSGQPTDVPFPVVRDVVGVLRPLMDALGGLPEGWRVGVMEHVKVVSGTNRVSAMFRGLDGRAFVIDHLTLDDIRGSRALFRPSRKAILFFRFSAPDVVPVPVEADAVAVIGAAPQDVLGRNALLSRQFENSLTGELVHELIHLRRYLGLIDEALYGLLVRHGKDLRLLDSELNTYMRAISRPDGATSQPGRTLRARYEADYSTKPDPADAVDEEYATHLAELAWHGQLLPQELAPVRTALEELFGEPMARRLAALDTNPGLAPVAPSVGLATPGLIDLRAAQTMEAMGRTPVEIQSATGWFRDAEGSWRMDPRHSRQASGPAVASLPPAPLAPEAEAAMLLEQLAVIEDLRLAGSNIEADAERILARLEELAAKATDTEYSRTSLGPSDDEGGAAVTGLPGRSLHEEGTIGRLARGEIDPPSANELAQAADGVRTREFDDLVASFGGDRTKAERFQRLWREAEQATGARADALDAEREALAREAVANIETVYEDALALDDLARTFRDMEEHPQEVAAVIQRYLADLPLPNRTPDERGNAALAVMRKAAAVIEDNGLDSKAITAEAIAAYRSRFSDPQDAQFMVDALQASLARRPRGIEGPRNDGRSAVIGGDEDEPGGAFDDALDEWADRSLAEREHVLGEARQRAQQRRVHSRDVVEDPNAKLLKAINAMERKLLDAGHTLGEVAAALEAKFGMPFDPAQIGQREVWYRLADVVRGRRKTWTPEVHAELVRLDAEGLTSAQLAERMTELRGIPTTANQVRAQISLLGLSTRKWKPEHLAELQRLHSEGLPDREIARRMTEMRGVDTSPDAVRQQITMKGLVAKNRRARTLEWLTEVREEALDRMVRQGMSDAEIAATFKADPALEAFVLTETSIKTARNRFGLASQRRGGPRSRFTPEALTTAQEMVAEARASGALKGDRGSIAVAREIAEAVNERFGTGVTWGIVYRTVIKTTPRERPAVGRPARYRPREGSPWGDPEVMAALTSDDISQMSFADAAYALNQRFAPRWNFNRNMIASKRRALEERPLPLPEPGDDRSAILGGLFDDEADNPVTGMMDLAGRQAALTEVLRACRS